MDACRISLLLLLLLGCLGGQCVPAPAHHSDVLLLVPQAGAGPAGMQLARLMSVPAHVVSPSSQWNSGSPRVKPSFVPHNDQLVLLKPVTLVSPHAAGAHQPSHQSRAVIPRPLSGSGESRQPSITTIHNRITNEAEPQNQEQSIDLMMNRMTSSSGASNPKDLSFFFPVKVNGSTVFVQRNVTVVPNPVTDAEDAAAASSGGDRGAKSTAGTLLHGLTREELSEIVSETLLQVLRQHGHLPENRSQTAANAAPDQQDEEDASDEPAAEEVVEERSSGTESGSRRATTTAALDPKRRRQLPEVRRKKSSGKKWKSETAAGHPGILTIFKPISTTPGSASPVDQASADMMMPDPLTLNDDDLPMDALLGNKQIALLDKQDKQKNQLFLKAIRAWMIKVLLDFEKMYGIPHEEVHSLAGNRGSSQIQFSTASSNSTDSPDDSLLSSSTAAAPDALATVTTIAPVPSITPDAPSVIATTAVAANGTESDRSSLESNSTQVPLN